MIQLSIVVPVYNVERFLPRCLDSLLRQGLQEGTWEVVCVNDGSTDRSAEVLATYAEAHPDEFRILTQENQGVAAARNAGLEVARGEWITFVDSDDYVVDGGFRYVLDHFCEGTGGRKPDMVTYWMKTMNPYQLAHHKAEEDVPTGKLLFEGDGADFFNRAETNWVTNRLLRRRFLLDHQLRFQPLFMGEDVLLLFHIALCHPHVVQTSCNIYRYMQDNTISYVRSSANLVPKLQAMLHRMDLYDAYMAGPNPILARGVSKHLESLVPFYVTRTLWTRFSRADWEMWMGKVRHRCRYISTQYRGKWRVAGWMLEQAVRSYPMYRLAQFLYGEVFHRFIRQWLA